VTPEEVAALRALAEQEHYAANVLSDGIHDLADALADAQAEVAVISESHTEWERKANTYRAELDRLCLVMDGWDAMRDATTAERDGLQRRLDAVLALIADGVEAFRLTKEYVNIPDANGHVLLPDIEGWSHFDWTTRAAAALDGTAPEADTSCNCDRGACSRCYPPADGTAPEVTS